MKLLIVTQAVDTEDPILGFFVRWIEEFAKHCEKVTVICLREGECALPGNVEVIVLGEAVRFLRTLRFLRSCILRHSEYDKVFVHMNPEYIIAAGILWRLMRKRVGLWYTHKNVDLKLRIAAIFAHSIFTASREGFFLKTHKLRVMGHGIDTALFRAPIKPFHAPLRIVSVGRVTPIKNLDTLIEAMALLAERGIDAEAVFIGAPTKPSDEAYLASLQALARRRNVSSNVHFVGSIPYTLMPGKYRDFDISVNLSPAGGMDKAVLESMAAGLLVFVSNQAFTELLGPYAGELTFKEKDAVMCAKKIATFASNTERAAHVRADLQKRVETMNVQKLIPRILSFL